MENILLCRPTPSWVRGLDLVCCVLALPFLAVLTVAMAIGFSIGSPGPVIFRQERIGRGGRRFMIFKFRTMGVRADQVVHQNHVSALMASGAPMVKLDAGGDARLVPGGWMLRASGLDELPQIFNVLRGDMSVVGPRPCLPGEFANYLPEHRQRVEVVPGLTGLWQVSGKNKTTFEEMIQMDVHYARHVSVPLYLKIILLTPGALVAQFYQARKNRMTCALAGAS